MENHSPEDFVKSQLAKAKADTRKWELILSQLSKVDGILIDGDGSTKYSRRLAIEETGHFMTGRQIYEACGSPGVYASFSTMLGRDCDGAGAELCRIEIDTKDNSKRFWYGLKEWVAVTGDVLPEYKSPILKTAKQINKDDKWSKNT